MFAIDRTDPLYIVLAIAFAIILLLVLLTKLRAAFSEHRADVQARFPAGRQSSRREDPSSDREK